MIIQMTRTSKQSFFEQLHNIENAFLLQIDSDQIYLISDMEYGGTLENARVEMMRFCLNPSETILDDVSNCRGRYAGGITFLENDKELRQSIEQAKTDFLTLSDTDTFLLCENDELKQLKKYAGKQVYIYVN